MRFIVKPALWSLLFFSASGLHAQGIASRGPAGMTRYANSGTDFADPLAPIRVERATPARGGPPAEVISVQDLAVPAKAAKEFQRSMKAFQSGDFRTAAGHLEKAIQIAPDFVQAHNNLGAAYIDLHEYESAVAQLKKTIELAPNIQEPYNNLGMALLLLRRFSEAETAARRALELAPQHSSARYTLGRILAVEGRDTPEAVELLSQAASDFPQARLPLAQVLLRRGSVDQAIFQLRTYLKDPEPSKKEWVEAWLARISGDANNRTRPALTPAASSLATNPTH
jgi:Flp pilus assembly protein TadD